MLLVLLLLLSIGFIIFATATLNPHPFPSGYRLQTTGTPGQGLVGATAVWVAVMPVM